MSGKSYAQLVDSVWPRVVFIKTKKPIDKGNFATDFWNSVVYDDDLPKDEFPKDPVFFPLCVEKYPSVLRSMTASQAGWWAMKRCDAVGWRKDEENIRCCLRHLEMDM